MPEILFYKHGLIGSWVLDASSTWKLVWAPGYSMVPDEAESHPWWTEAEIRKAGFMGGIVPVFVDAPRRAA